MALTMLGLNRQDSRLYIMFREDETGNKYSVAIGRQYGMMRVKLMKLDDRTNLPSETCGDLEVS